MPELSEDLPQHRIIRLIEGLLAERSIERRLNPNDDLREAGLSSLDMVSLVLSVEAEFDIIVPEVSITPAQFRSVSAISELVGALLGPR
ncbi:MAG TPA: phosphopantetheine-binding protein [Gemmatimonadaceae bacterium]|nr:phosphopantetheine-binding protein [Gemmatimonadaceae bacterium]